MPFPSSEKSGEVSCRHIVGDDLFAVAFSANLVYMSQSHAHTHPLKSAPLNCSRITLVLYRKRTARRFRLASTSGVRFRYSRQKEAARGCGGRGVLWEFNRFLPEKPCQTGTLAKTLLLIFTM